MLKNYFKIACRHLLKSRSFTAINVLGLSIGIGFTLLIAAYVWRELQVNRHLRNIDQQYIIQSRWKDPNMGLDLTTVGPLAKALKEQYPDLVANYYRWDGITSTVSNKDKIFREGLQIGDSTLLSMFGFNLLYGDARTALNEPFCVVITEERAIKYFGRKDVVNETVTIEDFSGAKHDFKITGVLQLPVDNSVIHLTPENDNQFFIPEASAGFFGRGLDAWNDPYKVGYIELQKGIRPQDLAKPMQDLLKKNAPAELTANMQPFLVPLKDYYLDQFDGMVRKMLYAVSLIALFILLMAIVNFVNISIGNAAARIKEIGVRKVMGSRHRQLVLQFLVEFIVLVALSTAVALGIYSLGRPLLSDILGKAIPEFADFPLYVGLTPLLLALLIGLLAGIYPAFVLSRLRATDAVKGKLQSVSANILLRKTLVGFQICTASLVFIGVVITIQQVNLFFGKNLGYNKDYVVSVQVPRDWTPKGVQHMLTVRNELEKLPEATNVSLTYSVPNGMSAGNTMVFAQGRDSSQAVAMETVTTDENYLAVYSIPLIAGRYHRHLSDSLGIVVNQSAVTALGFKNPGEAVGQTAFLPGRFPVTILGVTRDFHFGSMKQSIKPLLMLNVGLTNIYRVLSFKLKPGSLAGSMEAIQKKWTALLPGSSFEYSFMDDALKQMYASEIRLKKAAQAALLLSFVIVLLGISGLLSLNVQKRTKEIGIRKVVGASAINILGLFLRDFLPVVFAGGLLSIPIAWLVMQQWLNDYAYRIQLTYLPFVISIAVLLLLAAILISLQASKIAVDNPAKSLRTE
ncbi:MAG TPA: FtsX-like permease family protein [Flavisolibacter sp.]|jgi:ABC-type antimicrobial peptide transport system permease subunit|nr:FtsX-like permease family protein [Flavisolibacter sp.]